MRLLVIAVCSFLCLTTLLQIRDTLTRINTNLEKIDNVQAR